MTKITLYSLLLVLFLTVPSLAGGGTVPSFMVYPGNVQSVDWNPALLGMSPHTYDIHLNIADVNVWTNAWTAEQIITNINAFWDEDTKEKLLGSISGNALGLGANASSGLYFSMNNWSINQKAKAHVFGGVDKELFRTLLEGITLEDMQEYQLENNKVQALAVADTGFHMAFPLQEMAQGLGWENAYIGAGVHYLYGLAWGEGQITGTLKVDEDFKIEGDGQAQALFSATGINGGGGHGAATDLGFWAQMSPELGIGVSLTNLGFIRWNGVQGIDLDASMSADMGKILEQLFDDNGELDEDWFEYDIPDFDAIDFVDKDPQTRATPFSLQGGVHYQATNRIHLAGSIGFSQEPISHGMISVGSRFFYPRWLPISVSLDYATYKGTPSLATALELHLGAFEIKLSLSDLKLIGAFGKEASIGLSTSVRF